MELEFLQQIFEKVSNIKFHQIRSVGAELFQADRQADRRMNRRTDVTKTVVAFRNIANAPKTLKILWNPKFRYRMNEIPTQIIPANKLYFNNNFNIIPNVLFSSHFRTKPLYSCLLCHMRATLRPMPPYSTSSP